MRIMGLSLLNPEFPSPAGRFLLFTTKVMNRTFPSKIYLIFFLDTANLEINPCSKKNSVVKRTRIYRIDTDTSLVGRYCLPDSSHYMLYKSRDFVPGYSRFARYWLPAKSTIYATKQPKTDTYLFIFLFIDVFSSVQFL